MTDKLKTLKLSPTYIGTETQYLVRQVTDSLTPSVGDTIRAAEAQIYCESDMWKVTISESK